MRRALLAALLAMGCSKSSQAQGGGTSVADPGSASAVGAGHSGGSTTAPKLDDVRAAMATHIKVDPAGLRVERVPDAGPGGISVYVGRGEGAAEPYDVAAVVGGDIVLDRDQARAMVIKAWGYGVTRTVSPKQFAKVMGLLEGRRASAAVILEQFDIDSRGRWKRQLLLPRETSVDGKPAVEFWASTGGDAMLHKSTYVVNPDGTLAMSQQELE